MVISLLSVLGIVLAAGTSGARILALLASMNVAGAFGDIVMSVLAMRYSAHAFFVDERDGMRVFLPVKQQAYA